MSANNKAEAKRYIQKMYFEIRDVFGASKNILNEMIAIVDNASGQVSDKASQVRTAKGLIIKAQMFCVKSNSNISSP